MYMLSNLYALLPFSWYSWRFNHIHQPIHWSPSQYIVPQACMSQPSKWHLDQFSHFALPTHWSRPAWEAEIFGGRVRPSNPACGSFNRISASSKSMRKSTWYIIQCSSLITLKKFILQKSWLQILSLISLQGYFLTPQQTIIFSEARLCLISRKYHILPPSSGEIKFSKLHFGPI